VPLTSAQADLVEEHINLAHGAAWSYVSARPGTMSIDEARSAAQMGLVQAVACYPDYCAAHGFDPASSDGSYFRAYALRRIRGSILDEARHADPLTRGQRRVIKELEAALPGVADNATDEDAAAGLSARQVRDARAARAHNWAAPVHDLDDRMPAIADHTAQGDTEGQAVVSGVLAGFTAAFGRLDPEVQVVLALRYFRERSVEEIAEALRCPVARVTAMHDEGVKAVHGALLRSVAAALLFSTVRCCATCTDAAPVLPGAGPGRHSGRGRAYSGSCGSQTSYETRPRV
jgi:RNA polymerase sigma factor (sigma-70 family)